MMKIGDFFFLDNILIMLSLKEEKMHRLTSKIYIKYNNIKSSQTVLNLSIVADVNTLV